MSLPAWFVGYEELLRRIERARGGEEFLIVAPSRSAVDRYITEIRNSFTVKSWKRNELTLPNEVKVLAATVHGVRNRGVATGRVLSGTLLVDAHHLSEDEFEALVKILRPNHGTSTKEH